MPQSLYSNLQEILDRTLEEWCPEVISEAQEISMIMLEDGETLGMLGAYYSMNMSFENQTTIARQEPALGPKYLVEVIKRRNPGYDKLNFQICTAMYNLSCHSSYQKKYPNSCRGQKWRAVGDAVSKRCWDWDSNNEDEKKAIDIYRRMVKKAGVEVRGFGLFGDGDGALFPKSTRRDKTPSFQAQKAHGLKSAGIVLLWAFSDFIRRSKVTH